MIFAFIGPSGSGKTTILKSLGIPEIRSHTTRLPRKGETGDEYYFVSKQEYDKIEFLEKVNTHGAWYGTSVKEVEKFVKADVNCGVILNKKGVEIFKEKFGKDVVAIFITASKDSLQKRMRVRGDSIEDIAKRMIHIEATKEMDNYKIADITVNNGDTNDGKPSSIVLQIIKSVIEKSKTKIYISGKISGLDINKAKINFHQVEESLRYKGYTQIFNPMKVSLKKPTWENYMKYDIKELMDCTEIHFLPNWWRSRGARIEWLLATILKIKKVYIK